MERRKGQGGVGTKNQETKGGEIDVAHDIDHEVDVMGCRRHICISVSSARAVSKGGVWVIGRRRLKKRPS